MSIVINFLGGPGRGKSTAAYSLIGALKRGGYKAELLTEYSKWPAYKEDQHELTDQLYLMVQHNHRLGILEKLVDIVVTDTSLINCVGYSFKHRTLALNLYASHENNINILVPRKGKYMQYGRSQTIDEAIALDDTIMKVVHENKIPYVNVNAGDVDGEVSALVKMFANEHGVVV